MPAPPASRTVTNYNQGPTGGLGSNYSQTSGYVNTNAGPATSYSGSPQSSGYQASRGSFGGSTGFAGNASGPRNTGNPGGGNWGGSNNSGGIGGFGNISTRSGYDPGVNPIPGGIMGRGNAVFDVPTSVDQNWWRRNRNTYNDPGVRGVPGGIRGRDTMSPQYRMDQIDRDFRQNIGAMLPSVGMSPSANPYLSEAATSLLGRPSGQTRFGEPSQNVSRFTGFNNPFRNNPF